MIESTSKKKRHKRNRTKRPRKPLSEEGKAGRYDSRNALNDLTGKDWLLLTKSFWTSESCALDKEAYSHPAPFMITDVEKLVRLFTKRGMTVLDPFAGSGSALIAATRIGRRAIGIDINCQYKQLAERRLHSLGLTRFDYLLGDSEQRIKDVPPIDYVVTSPPYYSILRNNGKGLRHNSGKNYRIGARDGVQYYTEDERDLGNCDTYEEYLLRLSGVMKEVFEKLREGHYCTIIASDFTVNKVEVCVQGDIVRFMSRIGFQFAGTTVLLQTVKPLFPFGYPFAYKINHHHHNMITFLKPPGPNSGKKHRTRRRGNE